MDWMHRPGRLTAGIGIIVLGAALLAEQMTGNSYLQPLIRLWPLILLGVGLEMLIFRTDGYRGPDVGAIILLVIIGIVANSASGGWNWANGPWNWVFHLSDNGVSVQMNAWPSTSARSEEATLDGVQKLDVDGGPGRVEIKPAAGDQVRVRLEVVGGAMNAATAEQMANAVKLRISPGSSASVGLEFLKRPVTLADLRLMVEVPESVDELMLDVGSGGATVTDVKTDLTLDGGSGSMVVRNLEGSLKAEVGSGSAEFLGIAGDVVLEGGSGSMRLENPGGGVTIEGGSGSLILETDRIGGDYQIATGSGSAQIRIPRGADLTVEGETGSGSVRGPSWISVQDDQVSGRSGSGTYRLKLETGSGSVTITER